MGQLHCENGRVSIKDPNRLSFSRTDIKKTASHSSLISRSSLLGEASKCKQKYRQISDKFQSNYTLENRKANLPLNFSSKEKQSLKHEHALATGGNCAYFGSKTQVTAHKRNTETAKREKERERDKEQFR